VTSRRPFKHRAGEGGLHAGGERVGRHARVARRSSPGTSRGQPAVAGDGLELRHELLARWSASMKTPSVQLSELRSHATSFVAVPPQHGYKRRSRGSQQYCGTSAVETILRRSGLGKSRRDQFASRRDQRGIAADRARSSPTRARSCPAEWRRWSLRRPRENRSHRESVSRTHLVEAQPPEASCSTNCSGRMTRNSPAPVHLGGVQDDHPAGAFDDQQQIQPTDAPSTNSTPAGHVALLAAPAADARRRPRRASGYCRCPAQSARPARLFFVRHALTWRSESLHAVAHVAEGVDRLGYGVSAPSTKRSDNSSSSGRRWWARPCT